MGITAYSRFRRQGFRRAWQLAGMWEWCVNVGAGVIGLMLVYAFVGWSDALTCVG